MMKAMVVTQEAGRSLLVLQDVPEPKPAEGQVAIRMEGTAVSFGDIEMREGRYHTPRKPPVIPGHDVVGIVTEVGPGVSHVRKGQRVTAIALTGSFAEIVIAPAPITWLLPEEIDIASGAAFPTNAVTSYNLLTLAGRLVRGETVLVHSAAGGVGTTTVQLAKLLGAGCVIGTVGAAEKIELALEMGCDHVINYQTENFSDKVMDITEGRGADVILDSIAGAVTELSLACLAPWGRIVVYGMSGGVPGSIPTNVLHAGNRSAVGYSTGGHRYARPGVLRPAGDAVLEYMRTGKIRMLIGARYPLARANEALDLVASRKSTGRVVILNE